MVTRPNCHILVYFEFQSRSWKVIGSFQATITVVVMTYTIGFLSKYLVSMETDNVIRNDSEVVLIFMESHSE